jgi:hypothetical protein
MLRNEVLGCASRLGLKNIDHGYEIRLKLGTVFKDIFQG